MRLLRYRYLVGDRLAAEQGKLLARGNRLEGGASAQRGRTFLRIGNHQRNDFVGDGGAGERVDVLTAALANGAHVVVQLGSIFLAAQVEVDRLGQLGGVADVPAVLITILQYGVFTQEDLAFLAVGVDAAVFALDGDLGAHLAVGLVAPVDRHLGALAVVEVQRAVDLVVGVFREDLVQHGAADADRLAEVPVDQVDRVGCIVVQAAAAFGTLATPGRALRFQHDWPIRFGQHVGDFADGVLVQQAFDFLEGADETAVVANLVDQAFAVGQRGQFFRFSHGQAEWFFAEHVQTAVQGGTHHVGVVARWRGNQHRIQFDFLQHLLVVAIGFHAGVFVQYVQQITSGVADRRQFNVAVRVDHGMVR